MIQKKETNDAPEQLTAGIPEGNILSGE